MHQGRAQALRADSAPQGRAARDREGAGTDPQPQVHAGTGPRLSGKAGRCNVLIFCVCVIVQPFSPRSSERNNGECLPFLVYSMIDEEKNTKHTHKTQKQSLNLVEKKKREKEKNRQTETATLKKRETQR